MIQVIVVLAVKEDVMQSNRCCMKLHTITKKQFAAAAILQQGSSGRQDTCYITAAGHSRLALVQYQQHRRQGMTG